MVWQVDPPKARTGRVGTGVVVGLVAGGLIVLGGLSGGGWALLLLWLGVVGFASSRQLGLGFGMLLGSIIGAIVTVVFALPIAMMDRDHDVEGVSSVQTPVEPRTLAAVERVLDHPDALPDDGFWITNLTRRQVEVALTPDAPETTVEPGGMQTVDLAGECASVTMTETVSPDVGTREEICRGEFWQLVPYVPDGDEVKPGEAMPPTEWFDGMLRATYEPAEPIRIDTDGFMIVNTRSTPVVVRTLDGWELARLRPGQAAAISVTGCVQGSFVVGERAAGHPSEELTTMCEGSGWLFTEGGALEIHGSRY